MKKVAACLYDKPALLFLLFATMAFLPALLPFFYIKNDLVTQILPTRFFISESLHSGFFPWWNPYINYGIPQYGDMACGFWNPLLWLIAALFRYNIWTISFEEVFYIFLSGWGTYLALKELGIAKGIAILGGLSFMCSGYIVGHLQHFCWITGAAFLPFIFLYFIRINKRPSVTNFIAGALFTFLFFSATHPGLVIGAIYFFFFSLLAVLLFRKSALKNAHPAFIRNNTIFLALAVLFSICIIAGYAEAIPFLTRGEKLPGKDTVMNATTLQSYLSVLFPLMVHKSAIFNTDISMRNVYTGLLTLPGLFFFYRYYERKLVLFVMSCLLFFILLSSGGLFKSVANAIVPLASYVRSSGEFSLFPLFIMVLASAAGLHSLVMDKEKVHSLMGWLKKAGVFFMIVLIAAIILLFRQQESFLFQPSAYSLQNIKGSIKTLIDNFSIWDLLAIQSVLNLATVLLLYMSLSKRHYSRIAVILSGNLIIVCWFTLPYTGVGVKSKKEVNAILSSAPAGIGLQPLVPVNDFAITDSRFIAFTGMPYTYLKKMGTPAWDPYPIHLKNNAEYFKDSLLVKFINRQAFLFLGTDSSVQAIVNRDSLAISVQATEPGYIKASVRNEQFRYITLLQNDYIHWRVYIDGREVNHFTGYKSFITARIPPHNFTIEYRFRPRVIILLGWINFVILLMAVLAVLFFGEKTLGKGNPEKT